MRDVKGNPLGYHHRYPYKQIENIGIRGLGYPGNQLTTNNILRVVEGAYDVVLPDSCCVFGKITSGSLRLLKHYDLCLCPDSDVLLDRLALRNFYKTVLKNNNVLYIELIQNGDPHDIYISGRDRGKIISRAAFIQKMRKIFN
jgi:hypothetical protein